MKKLFITTLLIMICFSCTIGTSMGASSNFVASNLKGAAIKPNGKPIKVGISVAELASEFIISALEYCKWLLETAGAEVSVTNANYDTNAQMSHLNDFIEKGVDVIIVQPTDSEALAPAVRQVNRANIPIITINRSVYGRDLKVDLFVGADDALMGRKAAEFLIKEAGGSSFKVATLQGVLATANARDRAIGFTEVMKNNTKANIVSDRPCDWKPELAMAAVTDVLSVHPDLFAFFSHSDCMLPGVVSGLKQAGKFYPSGHKNHIRVVSIDGAPYALEQIREGVVDATIEQSPLMMATVAAKGVLTKVVKGEPLGEKTVLVDPVVITKENVNDPSLWGNFDVRKGELWPLTEEIWNKYLN